ncbi:hypothetical protein, partial [Paraburkholderia diazotrophica]|uniref:hypothetical protein n=1 Tax=Paraburkholderia diazotrophica TaxID=667676 RepID=UPI0031772826
MMRLSGDVGGFFGSKKPVDEHRKVVHNLASLLLMQQTQRRQGASCGCSLKTNSRQMWVLDDGARWFFGAAG